MKTKSCIKKYLVMLLMILTGSFAYAGDEPAATTFSNENLILWISVGCFVFILMVLAFIFYALAVFLKYSGLGAQIKLWQQVKSALTKEVPLDNEEHILMHHEYDGIRELDNTLPPWWVYMFYATIIFSFAYMFHYHISSDGELQDAEYQAELREAEVLKSKLKFVDENTVFLLTDATKITNGKTLFQQNCTTCHGKDAEGKVGPNLRDNQWIHGGEIKNIFKTIKTGTKNGMPSWESQLSPSQIQEVASYILSLKNSKSTTKPELGVVTDKHE